MHTVTATATTDARQSGNEEGPTIRSGLFSWSIATVIPESAKRLSGTAGSADVGVLGGPGSPLRYGRDDVGAYLTVAASKAERLAALPFSQRMAMTATTTSVPKAISIRVGPCASLMNSSCARPLAAK